MEAANAAKVEAGAARRAVEKAKQAEEKAAREAEDCQGKLEQTKADRKQLEEDAFKVAQAYEAAEQAASGKKKELEGVQGNYASLKKKVDLIKQVEVDISDQLEDYARVHAENEAKAKHWAAELDKLRKQHAGALLRQGARAHTHTF